MSRKSKIKQQKKTLRDLKPLLLEMAATLDQLKIDVENIKNDIYGQGRK